MGWLWDDDDEPESGTSTVKSEPWGPQQHHLKDIFSGAKQLTGSGGPQMYGGPLSAPASGETQSAWMMRADRARMGDETTRGAKGYTRDVLSGSYMGRNPYLDAMVDRASAGVVRNYQTATDPSLRSRSVLSGRTGGNNATMSMRGDANRQLAETLGGISTDIYGGDYQAERGRMESAATRAPAIAAMDYQDIDQLAQVGAEREEFGERQIGEAVQRHNYAQEAPYENLRRYLDFVKGGYGGTQTQVQPIYRNRAAGAMGGGMMGYQAGQMFGMNPYLSAAMGAYAGSR